MLNVGCVMACANIMNDILDLQTDKLNKPNRVFIKKFVEAVAYRFPDIPVILGGEHVTSMPEKILETCPGADICVLGEGEEAIIDLLQNYPKKLFSFRFQS